MTRRRATADPLAESRPIALVGSSGPLPLTVRERATRTVAALSRDAEDCRLLLAALDLP